MFIGWSAAREVTAFVILMTLDRIRLIWSLMRDGEFYTPSDLTNRSGQPIDSVAAVLDFLAKYGFVEQVTQGEPIFRKLADAPAPDDALRILQVLAGGGYAVMAKRLTSTSSMC
jgi:hypothetical protein